jgi:adenylate cyclase
MAAKRTPLRLPLLVLGAATALLWLAGSLDRVDNALGDEMLRRHAPSRVPPDDIVLIAIDQKSLEDLNEIAGKWPWPRGIHAELLDLMAGWKPKAVVFDLLMNEADSFNTDSDAMLRSVAATHDNLFFASARLGDGNQAPLAMLPPSFGAVRGPNALDSASATLLVPLVLEPVNWRGGLVNFDADADGSGRHTRLWQEIDGWRLPGMAAEIAKFAGATLPPQERIRLHWYGAAPRTISYADLFNDLQLEQPQIAPTLQGKILLIGAMAPGLVDLRPTPLAAQTPGAAIITTGVANLRAGDWLRDVPARWPLAALLVGGVVFGFVRRRHSAPMVIGLGLGAATLLCVVAAWLAFAQNLYVPIAAALLLGWLTFGLFTIQAQWLERREREETVGIFGRFLDPRVVEGLVETGELSRDQKPQARQITILFSDIRGFTTLSETRTPEAVVALLNDYFTRQVDVVFRHGGTLDKFIGDAIMAFWNAPGDLPDHADRGVAAALDMCRQLDEFRAELLKTEPDLGDFDVGIGLHTGPAVVGFLGSDTRMEYTAIGDTVNLGSRIEGTTKGVARVLVSESTRAACNPTRFRFEHRGQFHVKGREKPVDLYEPFHQVQT